MDRCKSTHWDHKRGRGSKSPRIDIPCADLFNAYAFVHRLTIKNKTYEELRHTITIRKDRSTTLERSSITQEGGLNRFDVATTLALGSIAVHKHTLKVVRSA